ncbi:MAG: insulinase family protein [Planctomycetes bacterium]|nr:insulinase family protein [Planctomycetota bacterium]
MVKASSKLKAITDKEIGETRHEAVLSCGMRLLVAPRPGFTKKVAFVVADYGSTDSSWFRDGKRVVVPNGIAHFLEHQLFKKSHGDLSDVFSERGAYCNAHTSHTQTAYYFECTERFDANLDTLLELALTPWFDRKLVDTERDIIIQEINQYRDHAGWVGFQQLLESLYAAHPIRIDIAGTAETVSAVTPELLALCHGTFYHPSNLTLIVTGDFKPAQVLKLAEALSAKWAPGTPPPGVTRERPDEPVPVGKPRAERRMFISRPRLLMGFKDAVMPQGDALTRRDLVSTIALDAMFSRESEAYERLYNLRLVGADFGAGYQAESGFGYAVIGGETGDPAALETELLKLIHEARSAGIDARAIERKRRKVFGRYLRSFNDPESTAYAYLGSIGQHSELFDIPEMLQSVTAREVNERINDLLVPTNYAASVLLPQGA